MVVETATCAEKCIAYLRENKIGRATFICLDRVLENSEQHMNQPFNPPKDSNRLFDLVKPNDPKFRIAFYYALKDTLVCETMDAAGNINKRCDEQR